MRETVILEIGQTPVSDHWDKSLLEITGEPVLQIFEKTGLRSVDSIFVANMLSGAANHQMHLGAYLGDWVGAKYAEAIHVETACASGAAAFRSAVMAVASGDAETAIAVGSEKMTDTLSEEMTAELATAADADYERDMGVSFVALNAMLQRRYMEQYRWNRESFAGFTLNAHANGEFNPNARFRKAITKETYMRSEMVSDPISVMDAAPIVDGAAAVLIVPLERVAGMGNLVRIAGSAAATDRFDIGSRKDPLWLSAAEKAAKKAYAQAGITPDDVDLFEAHDAFSIMAALSLEACGFAEQGTAPRLAEEGEITLNGRIPISTRGGLKARGHPVGATGLYQIVEAFQQLQGVCGKGQIENPCTALTMNLGGAGSLAIATILKI